MISKIKGYFYSPSGLMTIANIIVAASNYALLLFILQLQNPQLFSQWQALTSFIGLILSVVGGLGSYISKSVAQLESVQQKYEFQALWKARFKKWLLPLLILLIFISCISLLSLRITDIYTAILIGSFLVAEMFFYFNYHFLLGQELGKSSAITLLIYNSVRVIASIIGILLIPQSIWLPIGFICAIIAAYLYSQHIISHQFKGQHINREFILKKIESSEFKSIFTTSLGLFILALILNGFIIGFYSNNVSEERIKWSIYVFIGSLIHFAVAATLSLFIVQSSKHKSATRAINLALVMGGLSLGASLIIGLIWKWIAFLHHNNASVELWWWFGVMISLYNMLYILFQYIIGIKSYILIQKLSIFIIVGMIIWYFTALSTSIISTIYSMIFLIVSLIATITYSITKRI